MAVKIRFCDGAGGSGVKKQRVFSAPEARASKNNEFFLRRRVTRQKKTDFFCAGGSSVKKQRVFSAPEGQASKNNEFFLRRRVECQKTTSFFCAGGSSVKKQRIFSASEGRASKNNGFFLHRRFVPIKNRFPQQVRSISILKIFSFAHFFLHLPTSFLKTNTNEKK